MAGKYKADWIIIDEKIGRNMAEYLGLKVTGTLGVLLKAKQQDLNLFLACCGLNIGILHFPVNRLKRTRDGVLNPVTDVLDANEAFKRACRSCKSRPASFYRPNGSLFSCKIKDA